MHQIKFYAMCLIGGGVFGWVSIPMLHQMGLPLWAAVGVSVVISFLVSGFCLQGAEDQARLKDKLAEAEMNARIADLNRRSANPVESSVSSPAEKTHDNADRFAGDREPGSRRAGGGGVGRLRQIQEGVPGKPGSR
jgi:hypothetical protein